MSDSKSSRSGNRGDSFKPKSTPKSKGSRLNKKEKPLQCLCNSKDQETLAGYAISFKTLNSSSHSTSEENIVTEENTVTDLPREESSKNDDELGGEDISINRFESERKMLNDEYTSVSDKISYEDCGEPMPAQYLRLDFNPTEDMDNDEFRLNKCADFWKFINNHPVLNTLRVEPEPHYFNETDSLESLNETPSCSVSTISPEGMSLTPITHQALSCLEKGNLMNESLTTKQPDKYICEPECNGYFEYRSNRKDNWPEIQTPSRNQVLKSHTLCMSLRKPLKNVTNLKAPPLDDLGQMMAEMHKWDLEHPKSSSLNPPVHDLERKRRIVPYIDKDEDKLCEKSLH